MAGVVLQRRMLNNIYERCRNPPDNVVDHLDFLFTLANIVLRGPECGHRFTAMSLISYVSH